MKIILLTQYFPPEPGAGSNRAFENAKIWSDLGAKVTILTGFPHYPTGIIHPSYHNLKFLEENIDDIRVIRTFTISAPNKGFFKRVLSYTSFMFASIIQGIKSVGNQDVIIATSPPFFVAISGYIISRVKKIPFVFEVRDLWPESIVQLGQIKNKVIIKTLEFLEIFLYKKATHIISVTNSYIPIIVKKEINNKKITVIKNGVNLALFKPQRKNINLSQKFDLQNKFVIGYFGTLGISHAIDKVLNAAKLVSNNKDIHFLIIGDGAEKGNLLELKEKLNLTNVTFIKTINKTKLNDYYSIVNLMLVSLKNIPLFKTVIPSKMFEIMAMEKPFIITVDGEARKMVEEAKAGVFCPPEDPEKLALTIEKLMNQKEVLKQYGKNGRKYVEENFDRNKLAKEYLDLLVNLSNHAN